MNGREQNRDGFTSDTASLGGVRLHYLLGGNPSGPPVLLWHGFLSTSQEWRKVMPALAEAGYAVLVPDMRGFGDSDTLRLTVRAENVNSVRYRTGLDPFSGG